MTVEPKKLVDAKLKELATFIIAEENEGRLVTLKRIVVTKNFTDKDLPKGQKFLPA